MKMFLAICLLLSVTQISFAAEPPIDKEKVRRVMRSNMKKFKDCYDADKKNTAEGKVVLHWFIGQDGKATDVVIKETALNNASIENCVKEVIVKTTFPNALGDKKAEIIYPLIFQKGAIEASSGEFK